MATDRHSHVKPTAEKLSFSRHVRALEFGVRLPLHATVAFGLAMLLTGRPAQAGDDAALGEKVFNQCKICHTVVQGKNAIGPSLSGVVGRKAGTAPGFKYSDAMLKAGETGLAWDAATLNEYLKDPKTKVPGNKMTFAGLKNEEDRENVILFLKSKTQ